MCLGNHPILTPFKLEDMMVGCWMDWRERSGNVTIHRVHEPRYAVPPRRALSLHLIGTWDKGHDATGWDKGVFPDWIGGLWLPGLHIFLPQKAVSVVFLTTRVRL